MTDSSPDTVVDYISLQQEYTQLAKDIDYSMELERKAKTEAGLTETEQKFLESVPDKCRRAVEITRILRKTNTGPAKVKAPKKTKKAMTKEALNNLLGEL